MMVGCVMLVVWVVMIGSMNHGMWVVGVGGEGVVVSRGRIVTDVPAPVNGNCRAVSTLQARLEWEGAASTTHLPPLGARGAGHLDCAQVGCQGDAARIRAISINFQ